MSIFTTSSYVYAVLSVLSFLTTAENGLLSSKVKPVLMCALDVSACVLTRNLAFYSILTISVIPKYDVPNTVHVFQYCQDAQLCNSNNNKR